MPSPAPGHQFGKLGVGFLDGTEIDMANFRRALGATGKIVVVLVPQDVVAGLDVRDLVGACPCRGQRRKIARSIRTDRSVVIEPLGHDHDFIRQIGKSIGKGFAQFQPHLVLAQLGRALHPVHDGLGRNSVGWICQEVDRIDHIVSIKFAAIMEHDVVAQIEIHDGIALPFPALGQQGIEFTGLIVEQDQAIPTHLPHDDKLSGDAEIGVDNGNLLVRRPVQRVIRLARHCGQGRRQHKRSPKGRGAEFHLISPPRYSFQVPLDCLRPPPRDRSDRVINRM